MGMKIINSNGNTCLLKMTQEEWQDIGAKQYWVEPKNRNTKAKDTAPIPVAPAPDDSKPDIGNTKFLLPTGDTMSTRIERYSDKAWAVYISGEFGEQLLCLTCYLKGAAYVKRVIDDLVTRLSERKGQSEVLGDEVQRLRGQGQASEVAHGNN
jgi:hypothetical protein